MNETEKLATLGFEL